MAARLTLRQVHVGHFAVQQSSTTCHCRLAVRRPVAKVLFLEGGGEVTGGRGADEKFPPSYNFDKIFADREVTWRGVRGFKEFSGGVSWRFKPKNRRLLYR